jgi:hypothetical protein
MKRLLLAAAASLALAACTTATPYQPLTTRGAVTGGFSEIRVTPDRFRVTFSGNTLTSRETVERYLLFRAAELTLAEGHDWFALADRHTDRQSRTYVTRDPFGYDMWRPTWQYLGRGRWVLWDPWGPRRFWADDIDVQRVDKYEASAEIFLGRGPKPVNDPAAFDAREVIKNLGPSIVRPTP